MKILIIEDDDCQRHLYSMTLENMSEDVEISEAISGREGVEKISHEKFDLIICDYHMEYGKGSMVYNHLLSTKNKTPYILFTTETLESIPDMSHFNSRPTLDFYLNKADGRKKFRQLIKQFFEERDVEIDESKDFKRIKIFFFWKFNKSLCDIYVKLSNVKFVRIINKDTYYSKEDIDKYINRKQKYLYIFTDDYEQHSANLAQTPFLILDTDNIKKGDKDNLIQANHAMIHELVKSVGISSSVIALAKKQTDEMLKVVNKDDHLYKMMIRARSKRNYIYDHSYLTTLFACEICSKMEWTSKETLQKLAMASTFHDLLLNDPNLAMIDDLETLLQGNYTPTQISEFKRHPLDMAEMLQNCKHMPADIDTIVLQHHENVTGTGYPHKLSPIRISQLVCVFIIAHDFVNNLYNVEFDQTQIPTILNKFKLKYAKGNFKTPSQTFVNKYDLGILKE